MKVLYFWIVVAILSILFYRGFAKDDNSGDGRAAYWFLAFPCLIGFGLGGTVVLTGFINPVMAVIYLAFFSGVFYIWARNHSGPYLLIALAGVAAAFGAFICAIFTSIVG